MKIEDVRKILEDDNYIDIAINEYLKFKNSELYKEKIKFEILQNLNKELSNLRITPQNVNELIKKLKDINNEKGPFVYWGELDKLLNLVKNEPEKVSKALNELFDDSIEIVERINNFVNSIAGKIEGIDFSPGTPLIGYLLASYESSRYPIYMDKIFRNFLSDFGIEEKFSDKAEKYYTYLQICNILKDFLEEKGYLKNSNILDIQDFLYCVFSGNYQDLTFKVSLKYLKQKAEFIEMLMQSDQKFIDYINQLDKDYIKKLFEKYSDSEKVNLIRYKVAKELLENKITLNDLEKIKEEVVAKYEKQILKPWNNFRILFPFFYEKYKEKVKIELEKLSEILLENIMKNFPVDIELEKHIVDFYGPQNFGSKRCWLVLYPKRNSSHQKSAQFGFLIYSKYIEYGFYIGNEIEKLNEFRNIKSDFEKANDIERISLTNILGKYKQVFQKFIDVNKKINPPLKEEKDEKDEINWNKKIETRRLFFENNDILLSQISTSLKSGKHIILVGPPGTGKSKLAKEICESYQVEYEFITAVSDWSTFDTIGGYRPNVDGSLYFDEGILLKVLKSKGNEKLKWLIIDEINRADIDKAFGPFFSVLTGDKVTLSLKTDSGKNIKIFPEEENIQEITDDNIYVLPKDFRIIGTMNTYDKTSLYELSYAFMRRFAFIYVGIPKNIDENLVERFLNKWEIEDKTINNINLKEGLTEIWNIINKYRPIGPAIIKDIANFVSLEGDYTSAIILYAFPQFEGVMESKIKQFVKELLSSNIKDFSVNKEVLFNFVEDFFSIDME